MRLIAITSPIRVYSEDGTKIAEIAADKLRMETRDYTGQKVILRFERVKEHEEDSSI